MSAPHPPHPAWRRPDIRVEHHRLADGRPLRVEHCPQSGARPGPHHVRDLQALSPVVEEAQDAPDDPELAATIKFEVPHSARVWNYWLGGKDNYPADRVVADAVLAVNPGVALTARQCRRFLVRAVRFLAAEVGIRQFLDIGTGLPTVQNTHEVAQAIAADSRIVYVDNDPLVLAHARALLTDTTAEGVTTYLHADVREPESIITDARNVLNFTQPIAVMLLGILGHAAPEFDTMRSILARLMAGVPSGSYLVLMDGADTTDEVHRAGVQTANRGTPHTTCAPSSSSPSASQDWNWSTPAWFRSPSGARTPPRSAPPNRAAAPTARWRASREE